MTYLGKSCLGPLFFAQRSGSLVVLGALLRSLFRALVQKIDLSSVGGSEVLIVHNSSSRRDLLHDAIALSNHFTKSGIKVSLCDVSGNFGVNYNVNRFHTSVTTLRREVSILESYASVPLTLLQKLYLLVRVYEASILLRQFDNQLTQCATKVVLLHKEMEFIQNVFAQACLNNGIKCIALQHGFYEDGGYKVGLNNVNPINYLASISAEIWCWGESSRELFQKYCTGRPRILGLPYIGDAIDGSDLDDGWAIFFDSVDRQESNHKLEALKSSLKLQAFYHPDDTRYVPRGDVLVACRSKTIIGCHSSVLVRAALAGRRVLLLRESRLLADSTHLLHFRHPKTPESLVYLEGEALQRHVARVGEAALGRAASMIALELK